MEEQSKMNDLNKGRSYRLMGYGTYLNLGYDGIRRKYLLAELRD